MHQAAAIREKGLAEVLAIALELDELAVSEAKLVRCGLLRYAESRHGQGVGFVTCLQLGKRANIVAGDAVSACSQMIYELALSKAPRPTANHLASPAVVPLYPVPPLTRREPEEFHRLYARLSPGLAAREPGVHILVAGARPDGQSLCRALSRRLGARLFG